MVMSKAVVFCWLWGSPEALRNGVLVMPRSFACWVIVFANSRSVPVRNSARALAMSLADFVAKASIAFRMVIDPPAGIPNLDGGWRAAYGDILMLVSKVKSPLSRPRNTK